MQSGTGKRAENSAVPFLFDSLLVPDPRRRGCPISGFEHGEIGSRTEI